MAERQVEQLSQSDNIGRLRSDAAVFWIIESFPPLIHTGKCIATGLAEIELTKPIERQGILTHDQFLPLYLPAFVFALG